MAERATIAAALQEALGLAKLAASLTGCRSDDDYVAGVRAKIEAAISLGVARPLDGYHEDYGFVTWWTWRDGEWLGEPSYVGSPNCSDWPGYHTHWTPHPDFPEAPL
ncbi:hypothetical protein LB572_01210 [Mesorhizobium sp. BH1-1-5]|uniref:hypothetical protein n=1 Tax=Mesorhizobium sp. BH1-1-5 TaxID=2876661 RepID=UPI001CCF97AF|nr:hypothetical protein [Mesorhizobium sp. BH1-1-5]MBZ9985708.1 hypothetical protein [Mesorhizobium sp. BH1-1-5]